MLRCLIIILSIVHVTLSVESCVRGESSENLNYDVINVMEGIKLKRDVATIHNNQTKLEV
jgi:hypothetical protein